MGHKVVECLASDGKTHHSWIWRCPACKAVHHCDNRWGFNGSTTAPTFTGSVLVHAIDDPEIGFHRPRCHSFVTDGKIAYCADSTHAMAGQTVELPDWDGWAYELARWKNRS
jgi:hypothetical protein